MIVPRKRTDPSGWLNRAGVEIARRPDQSAAVPLEISPLFALDAEELRDRLSIEGPVTEPLWLQESGIRSQESDQLDPRLPIRDSDS
jgi:hypothetical protein